MPRHRSLTAALLVTALLVTAFPAGLAEAQSYYDRLSAYPAQYNENLDKVPGLIRRMFANERIELHIALPLGGVELIGVVTGKRDAKITEYDQGGISDPTLRVYADGTVIDGLLANPSRDDVLRAVLALRLEGVGFAKRLKVGVLSIILRIGRRFL